MGELDLGKWTKPMERLFLFVAQFSRLANLAPVEVFAGFSRRLTELGLVAPTISTPSVFSPIWWPVLCFCFTSFLSKSTTRKGVYANSLVF
jgi:hypothetical protein